MPVFATYLAIDGTIFSGGGTPISLKNKDRCRERLHKKRCVNACLYKKYLASIGLKLSLHANRTAGTHANYCAIATVAP